MEYYLERERLFRKIIKEKNNEANRPKENTQPLFINPLDELKPELDNWKKTSQNCINGLLDIQKMYQNNNVIENTNDDKPDDGGNSK